MTHFKDFIKIVWQLKLVHKQNQRQAKDPLSKAFYTHPRIMKYISSKRDPKNNVILINMIAVLMKASVLLQASLK